MMIAYFIYQSLDFVTLNEQQVPRNGDIRNVQTWQLGFLYSISFNELDYDHAFPAGDGAFSRNISRI